MNIRSIQQFIVLAEAGSFYAAAQQVHMSQQGLNKSITTLESDLGMKLIERSRKGIRLTPQGEIFFTHARLIVDEYHTMLDEMAAVEPGPTGSNGPLIVNTTYYPIQVISAFNDESRLGRHSMLEHASIIERSFEKLLQMANDSDGTQMFLVDLHYYSRSALTAYPDLVFEPVFKTQVGVVMSEENPLSLESSLHRSTVSRKPIAYNANRDMAKFVDWLFKDRPLVNVYASASNSRMLIDLVHDHPHRCSLYDSFGFAVSKRDPMIPTDDIRFVPLSSPEAAGQVGVLYNSLVPQSARILRVVNEARQFLEEEFGEYVVHTPAPVPAFDITRDSPDMLPKETA